MIYNLKEKFERLKNKIVKTLFVDKYNCLACDMELPKTKRSGLCDQCEKSLSAIQQNYCHKCGRIQENEADYCITCMNYQRNFDFARSYCVYEGKAVDLVWGLKFGGKKYFAKYMANCMVDKFLDENMSGDLLIPVPLSRKRQKHRGYNQSQLLAKEISNQLKINCDCRSVVKVLDTPEQAKKVGKERELNVLNAYAVVDQHNIKGKNIILIDDVLTTGATTSEIAKVLYKAKAKSVCVLTFCSTRYKVQSL